MTAIPTTLTEATLGSRHKRADGFAYKLGDTGSFGMDVGWGAALDIDEAAMSVRVPFADGNRRDGVGDLLEVAGIDTSRHRKNAVVLFDHGKSVTLPIAMALRRDGDRYDPDAYTVAIDPAAKTASLDAFFYQGKGAVVGPGGRPAEGGEQYDHALFCEQLFDMVVKRMLGAGSIGYQVVRAVPLHADYATGTPQGLHLLGTLMLEGSVVVMPANADTVRKALCLPRVCGKPLSPMLVKSLTPYAGPKKAQLGYEGKMSENDRRRDDIRRSQDEAYQSEMRATSRFIAPRSLDSRVTPRSHEEHLGMNDDRSETEREMAHAYGSEDAQRARPPLREDDKAIPPARWKPGVGAVKAQPNRTREEITVRTTEGDDPTLVRHVDRDTGALTQSDQRLPADRRDGAVQTVGVEARNARARGRDVRAYDVETNQEIKAVKPPPRTPQPGDTVTLGGGRPGSRVVTREVVGEGEPSRMTGEPMTRVREPNGEEGDFLTGAMKDPNGEAYKFLRRIKALRAKYKGAGDYEDGYAARLASKPREQNPHAEDARRAKWEEGYAAADADLAPKPKAPEANADRKGFDEDLDAAAREDWDDPFLWDEPGEVDFGPPDPEADVATNPAAPVRRARPAPAEVDQGAATVNVRRPGAKAAAAAGGPWGDPDYDARAANGRLPGLAALDPYGVGASRVGEVRHVDDSRPFYEDDHADIYGTGDEDTSMEVDLGPARKALKEALGFLKALADAPSFGFAERAKAYHHHRELDDWLTKDDVEDGVKARRPQVGDEVRTPDGRVGRVAEDNNEPDQYAFVWHTLDDGTLRTDVRTPQGYETLPVAQLRDLKNDTLYDLADEAGPADDSDYDGGPVGAGKAISPRRRDPDEIDLSDVSQGLANGHPVEDLLPDDTEDDRGGDDLSRSPDYNRGGVALDWDEDFKALSALLKKLSGEKAFGLPHREAIERLLKGFDDPQPEQEPHDAAERRRWDEARATDGRRHYFDVVDLSDGNVHVYHATQGGGESSQIYGNFTTRQQARERLNQTRDSGHPVLMGGDTADVLNRLD